MANYTTMVRTICEFNAGYDESVGFNDVSTVIEASRSKIFNFNYPIFDESYKSVLETKILKHYYTREIGLETVGLWKLKLDTKLNEIMPYYNQLYKSELLEFNPLYDVDFERTHNLKNDNSKDEVGDNTLTETQTGNVNVTDTRKDTNTQNTDTTAMTTTENDGSVKNIEHGEIIGNSENTNIGKNESSNTTTANTTNENAKTDKYSDTPQGEISNLNSSKYLTNARVVDDEAKSTSTTKTTDNIDTRNTQTDNSNTKSDNTLTSTTHDDGTSNTTTSSDTTGSYNSDTSSETFSSNSKNGTNKTKVSATITTLEDYVENVKGKQGGKNYSEMLQDFRNTFLNIDMQIIEELSDLFMLIW